jgi:hypothetical protein
MLPPPLPLEILRLVIEFTDSSTTLAALARVNQDLSEVALDKLWSRLDCLYALAKCMPNVLWDEYETKHSDGFFRYKERIVVSVVSISGLL